MSRLLVHISFFTDCLPRCAVCRGSEQRGHQRGGPLDSELSSSPASSSRRGRWRTRASSAPSPTGARKSRTSPPCRRSTWAGLDSCKGPQGRRAGMGRSCFAEALIPEPLSCKVAEAMPSRRRFPPLRGSCLPSSPTLQCAQKPERERGHRARAGRHSTLESRADLSVR